MKTVWSRGHRKNEQWEEAELQRRTTAIPAKKRMDVVLMVGVAGAVGLLFLVLLLAFLSSSRLGWIHPPLLEPLRDERILQNIHDSLPESGLLDAATHKGDAWMLQDGGQVHHYDPTTQLWVSQKPFQEEGLQLQRLRSDALDVGGKGPLWALSSDGGLVRRENDEWRMLFSDTSFRDRSGKPFSTPDLSSAAVSDDGRWLMVGTKFDGVGLYHIPERRWMSGGGSDAESLLSGTFINHVLWWKGRFWAGGPAGLFGIDPETGQAAMLEQKVAVRDMDARPDGPLWVLGRKLEGQCQDCTWFARFDSPGAEPVVLLDERIVFPELDLADLQYAFQSEDLLLLAGRAGIYSYDTRLHYWRQYYDKDVTVAHKNGSVLHFAGPGLLGAMRKGEVLTWPADSEDTLQMVTSPAGDTLALTLKGAVYRLKGTYTPELLMSGIGNATEKRYTNGVAMGDDVLLIGPEAGLLHNVTRRSYRNLDPTKLPLWLSRPGTQLIHSGETLYMVNEFSGGMQLYTWPSKSIVNLNKAGLDDPQLMPIPKSALRDWDGNGLVYVAMNGQALSYRPEGATSLTGKQPKALRNAQLLDVVAWRDDLAMTTTSGVTVYDGATRAFSVPATFEDRVEELAARDNHLLMRTSKGRLLSSTNPRQPQQKAVRIGKGVDFPFEQNQISDGYQDGPIIFLAGNGRVARYDTQERGVTRVWDTGGSGPVTLVGNIGEIPLAHANGQGMLGDLKLPENDGFIHSMGFDDTYVWTLREKDGVRYLKGHRIDAPKDNSVARCFYRNPSPGRDVSRIDDARTLTDGTVAVATNAGLRFYNPRQHSWFKGPRNLMRQGGRVYLLPGHLVLQEDLPTGTKVSLVPFEKITAPNPCSDDPYVLEAETFEAVQLAVNEPKGEAAWLSADGSVTRWKEGKTQILLAEAGAAPRSQDLRRALNASSNNTLLFSTKEDTWSYDVQQRAWSRHQLSFDDPERVENINLAEVRGQVKVSAKALDGDLFLGNLDLDSPQVAMQRLYMPPNRFFGTNPNDLLDVQGRPSTMWVFVLSDRVVYYDPRNRQWSGSQALPANTTDVTYSQGAGLDIITTNGGSKWLVAQEYRLTSTDLVLPSQFASYQPRPGETTGIDSNRRIWRLTGEGELQRAEAQGSVYRNFETYAGPAFALDADKVRHAYNWSPLTLLETDDRLLVKNEETDRTYAVSERISRHVGIRIARAFEKELWLLNEEGLLRIGRTNQDTLTSAFSEGVEDLVFDHAGTPWIQRDANWQVWTGSSFQPPWTGESQTPAAPPAQVFVAEGAQATALDDKGFPYYWNAGFQVDDTPLDVGVPEPQAMFRGLGDDWWLLSGLEMIQVAPGYCMTSEPGKMDPCLKESQRLSLPDEFEPGNWARAGMGADGILKIVTNNLEMVEIVEDDNEEYRLLQGSSEPLAHLLPDVWPELKTYLRPLGNGRQALDPIIDLSTNASGFLVAVRPSGEKVVAPRGDVKLQQPEPLDVGWLQWERTRRGFIVDTPTGKTTFTRAQFIRDGRLLFEEVHDMVVDEDGLHAANTFGIWHFPQDRLALDTAGVTFQPRDLTPPISATHQHFRSRAGTYNLAGVQEVPPANSFRFHDVTFTETEGGIEGNISVGDAVSGAWAERGFAWDGSRLGLVYEGQNLLLRSGAGFHPVNRLAQFDPGPPGTSGKGRAQASADGQLHLKAGNQWWRRQGGSWETASNPADNQVLIDAARWNWRLAEGELQVNAPSGPMPLVQGDKGIAFAHDLIQGAAFPDGKLAVMTQGAYVLADNPSQLADDTARHWPAVPTDSLEAVRETPDAMGIYRFHEGELSLWNVASQRFVNARTNPKLDRPLVTHRRLRIEMMNGQAQIYFKSATLGGEDEWIPAPLSQGRFPFDRITALGVRDKEVYLGTPIGLQYYLGSIEMTLDHMIAAYDLRTDTSDPPAAVTRIGSTIQDPKNLYVQSTGATVHLNPGAGPRAGEPVDLKRRLRVDNTFWRWVQEEDNQVVGHYNDGTRRFDGKPITFRDGRFPHDSLRDLIVWENRAFSLWDNGWVSVYPNSSLALQDSVRNLPMGNIKGRRFFTIPSVGAPEAVHLKSGLYLEDNQQKYWRYDQLQWQRVDQPLAIRGIKDYLANPPLYQRERLRLRQGVSLNFEQCTRNGIWRSLPWALGRVAIDRWHAMAVVDDHVWAATPAGIVSFEERRGSLTLNPDQVTVIREMNETQLQGQVTDLMYHNSTVTARINEDSKRLFTGTLNPNKDTSVFEPFTGKDPFAEREFVSSEETGYWSWQVFNRKSGRRGYLKGTLSGETVRLVAGRFDFDTLNSVALYQDGHLDLATDLGGWYRVKEGGLHVKDIARVGRNDINPLEITGVVSGRNDDGPTLGLRTNEDTYIRLAKGSPPQEVRDFRQWQGEDPLWRYYKNSRGLVMEARNDVGSAGLRLLLEGRFNDDRVLGFPLNTNEGFLVPTYAGVLVIDRNGDAQTIHTPPFPGLPEKDVPSVLLRRDSSVIYAGRTAFHELFDSRTQVAGLGIAAPDNYRLESIMPLAHGAWQAYWRDGEDRGFTRLRNEDMGTYPANQLYLDLSQTETFIAHRLEWGNPDPWLLLNFEGETIRVQSRDQVYQTQLTLPPNFQLVKPLTLGQHLILFGKHQIFKLNSARLATEVFSSN